MRRSLIVAVSENGVIGKNGQIPWRLPNDLKRFKALTMGHCLIMGRKTHVSIGKPLPGRTTIVLSRGGGYIPFAPDVFHATTFEEALEVAQAEGDDEVFICGGGQVYDDVMVAGVVDRIYLTVVERYIDGDTKFGRMESIAENFNCETIEHVEGAVVPHRFETWVRR